MYNDVRSDKTNDLDITNFLRVLQNKQPQLGSAAETAGAGPTVATSILLPPHQLSLGWDNIQSQPQQCENFCRQIRS